MDNFISKLIFENNTVFKENTFIDIETISTGSTDMRICPRIRVFFSMEGSIYIFIGNYVKYKYIQNLKV